ncbi:MAG: hypothetical protein ACXWFW_14860 [Usitatibacter sp.]
MNILPESHATEPPPSAIEFADSQTLNPSLDGDGKTSFAVAVRNPGEKPAAFDVVMELKDRSENKASAVVQLLDTKPLERYEYRFVRLAIGVKDGVPPYVGFLVLRSKDQAGTILATRSRPIAIRETSLSLASLLVVVLGVVGAATSVVAAAILLHWREKAKLRDEMGPPTWDFGRSWATNLTAIGAIVGGVLTATTLTEQPAFASKQAYTVLNIVFVFFIAIAPFLYNTVRRGVAPAIGATDPTYRGFVFMFYLASFVTLSGVFGQLGTIVLIFNELAAAHLLAHWELYLVESLLGIVIVGTVAYGVTTIFWTVKTQRILQTKSGTGPRAVSNQAPSAKWALL